MLAFYLTDEEFVNLITAACHYCGQGPTKVIEGDEDLTVGTIDRVDSSQGYLPTNSVPCCVDCNRAKGRLDVWSFKEWAKRLVAHCAKHKIG